MQKLVLCRNGGIGRGNLVVVFEKIYTKRWRIKEAKKKMNNYANFDMYSSTF